MFLSIGRLVGFWQASQAVDPRVTESKLEPFGKGGKNGVQSFFGFVSIGNFRRAASKSV
jgi:hypothetical protein